MTQADDPKTPAETKADARRRRRRRGMQTVALICVPLVIIAGFIAILSLSHQTTEADRAAKATQAEQVQIKHNAYTAALNQCNGSNKDRAAILRFLDQAALELSGYPSDQVVNATPAQIAAMIQALPANSMVAVNQDHIIFAAQDCKKVAASASP